MTGINIKHRKSAVTKILCIFVTADLGAMSFLSIADSINNAIASYMNKVAGNLKKIRINPKDIKFLNLIWKIEIT